MKPAMLRSQQFTESDCDTHIYSCPKGGKRLHRSIHRKYENNSLILDAFILDTHETCKTRGTETTSLT